MRRWLVVPSIAFHITLIIALLFLGAWHLDKLDAAKTRVTINYSPPPPPAEAAGSPAKQKPFVQKPHKELPHVIVVPPETPVPAELPTTDTTTTGTGNGSGTGSGSGEGSGSGTGSNESPCTSDCGPPVVVAVEQKKLITPSSMSALWISGERQIQPPEMVKNQLHREGKDQLSASFHLCLDAAGNVSSTKQLKSSGYAAYDEVLAQGIAQWRYRPYSVGGRGIPVCSVVTFIYAMK